MHNHTQLYYTLKVLKGLTKSYKMMSEIEKVVDDSGYFEPKKCIGCGREATRTNNTLCQKCWDDAEGEN